MRKQIKWFNFRLLCWQPSWMIWSSLYEKVIERSCLYLAILWTYCNFKWSDVLRIIIFVILKPKNMYLDTKIVTLGHSVKEIRVIPFTAAILDTWQPSWMIWCSQHHHICNPWPPKYIFIHQNHYCRPFRHRNRVILFMAAILAAILNDLVFSASSYL